MKATKSKGHSFSIPGLTPSKSLAERLNNLDQLKTPDRTVVRKINDIHNNEFRRGSGATHSSSSSTSSSSSHIASMSKTNNTNLSPSTSNTGSRHSGSKPGSQSGTAFLHNPFKLVEGRKFANVPGLKYMLPLDDKEFLRQADEHKLLKHLFNGIYKAPIAKHLDRGIAVLDVGCGCGSWILEMAQQYPRSSFTGIDVAPIFPRTEVPQNVGFRTHNLIADNKQLPYPDATFDFVFMRNMSLAVGEKDWQNLCRELVRVTKLGGYVELLDTDFELKRRGPKLADWNDKVIFALKARGFNPRIGPNLENFFKDDLVNAKKLFFSLPMGNWGGKTGMAARNMWSVYLRSFQPVMATAMGLSNDNYDQLCEDALAEMDTSDTYCNVYNIVGRRPLAIPDAPGGVSAGAAKAAMEEEMRRRGVRGSQDYEVDSLAAGLSRSTTISTNSTKSENSGRA